MDAKAQFVQGYPNIPCYLVFQEPYYKARVGDYRTEWRPKIFEVVGGEDPNSFVVEG